MKLYVFLDLDDSIFQTRRKCPDHGELFPAAVDRDGETNSWMTQRQRALFSLFESAGVIIPATARSYGAYSRVTLPFHHVAILNFGAVVLLPDGGLDERWDAVIRPRTVGIADQLRQSLEDVQKFAEHRFPGVYARLISDFGMPLYLVLKHRESDNRPLRAIASSGVLPAGEDWFLHFNDNNLALVPSFLGKENAVRYVIDHHLGDEPVMTLGMGDSVSDAGFMRLCDHAITPNGSQLQNACFPENSHAAHFNAEKFNADNFNAENVERKAD